MKYFDTCYSRRIMKTIFDARHKKNYFSILILFSLFAIQANSQEGEYPSGGEVQGLANSGHINNLKIHPGVMDLTKFPGESISMHDHSLTWDNNDIVIPGNGPTIALGRRHRTIDKSFTSAEFVTGSLLGVFEGWELNIPKITYIQNRYPMAMQGSDLPVYNRNVLDGCVGNGPTGFVNGFRIDINGVSGFAEISQKAINDTKYLIHTQFENNWLLLCSPFTTNSITTKESGSIANNVHNDNFTLVSPDGTQYRFANFNAYGTMNADIYSYPTDVPMPWRTQAKTYLIADIIDKHGNWLAFDYHFVSSRKTPMVMDGDTFVEIQQQMKLTKIRASDDREVTFEYYPTQLVKLKKIHYNNKFVEYQYNTLSHLDGALKKVILPGGLEWKYEYYAKGGAYNYPKGYFWDRGVYGNGTYLSSSS